MIGINKDNNYSNLSFVVVGLIATTGMLLVSSLGIFDPVLDISEKIQSNYRSNVLDAVNTLNEPIEAIGDITDLKNERDQFKQDLISKNSQIVDLEKRVDELEIIKAQNEINFDTNYIQVQARVIRFLSDQPGNLIINKGVNDGVNQGDIVIVRKYAVGEVVQSFSHTSQVKTLLASDSKVPVTTFAGSKGVLIAENGNDLKVEKILSSDLVEVNDVFITLGVNTNYPYGLFVGEVEEVFAESSETTKQMKLKNQLDFRSLNEVFILTNEL